MADVVVEDSIFTGVRLCVLTEFSAPGVTLTGNLLVASGEGATGIIARGEGSTITQNVIQAESGDRGAVLASDGALFSDNVEARAARVRRPRTA